MAGLGWMLVRSAPRQLSVLLPGNLTFGVGAGLFVVAVFSAFVSAFALRQPAGMLQSFVTIIVGVWFMFAATAGLRGSPSDDEMMKRFAAMMVLLTGLIVATLYVPDHRVVALLSLGMIGAGCYVIRDCITGVRR